MSRGKWQGDERERSADLNDRLSILRDEEEERLARYRADQLGLPYVNLAAYPINGEDLALVPPAEARQAQAVVFYKKGKDVRVGAVDPRAAPTREIIDGVTQKIGEEPTVHVISARSLQSALARYLPARDASVPRDEMRISLSALPGGQDQSLVQSFATLEKLGARVASLPPSEILGMIVYGATAMRASDIHVEPLEREARLRYRIDGVLQDVTHFSKEGWALIVSRVKVLSQLKLNVRDVPQDGSFVVRVGEEIYDMRVSMLPGEHGETVTIRILARKAWVMKMTDLGMKPRDYAVIEQELKRANGMILVTGPTGSGKTTTLASFLQEVNTEGLKIITLEDPVEYKIAGITQTEVDESSGYTFASGLRSILRQDPDILMIGEMRDSETAYTAIHAALTGHLVFSTLHTNNAPGAVPRLVSMGVKPYVLAPALNVVIAQRLVRVVCSACAEEYALSSELREHIGALMRGVHSSVFDPTVLRAPSLRLVRAKGCAACGETGYRGRTGVFEVFTVKGELEELVLQGADELQIRRAAVATGMTTIIQDAYLKVLERVTTVEEVERISEE